MTPDTITLTVDTHKPWAHSRYMGSQEVVTYGSNQRG